MLFGCIEKTKQDTVETNTELHNKLHVGGTRDNIRIHLHQQSHTYMIILYNLRNITEMGNICLYEQKQ